MKKDVVLMTDGSKQLVEPENGKDYQLDELQGFVEGYIEILYSTDRSMLMVVNEEGLLLGLELNYDASCIASEWGYVNNPIVGNVLVASSERVK